MSEALSDPLYTSLTSQFFSPPFRAREGAKLRG